MTFDDLGRKGYTRLYNRIQKFLESEEFEDTLSFMNDIGHDEGSAWDGDIFMTVRREVDDSEGLTELQRRAFEKNKFYSVDFTLMDEPDRADLDAEVLVGWTTFHPRWNNRLDDMEDRLSFLACDVNCYAYRDPGEVEVSDFQTAIDDFVNYYSPGEFATKSNVN